jgi:hypothetical protein
MSMMKQQKKIVSIIFVEYLTVGVEEIHREVNALQL